MSKAFKKLAPLDPVANVAVSGKATGFVDPTASVKSEKEAAGKKEAEAAALAAQGGTSKAAASKTLAVAEREGELKQAAAAAGATRIDTDYDLLGVGRPSPKKRGASRTLLG
jgi:hypothetical protein